MKKTSAAIFAFVAAGAGYLGGLLSAPRSGKQTRKKIAKSASKAKTDGEKQLKSTYKEVQEAIENVEKKIKATKGKADSEMKDAVKLGKDAQKKAKMMLSALRDGDADDPDLKAAISEVKKARDRLKKFVKSK
jgi:gas vesicle protein